MNNISEENIMKEKVKLFFSSLDVCLPDSLRDWESRDDLLVTSRLQSVSMLTDLFSLQNLIFIFVKIQNSIE